MEGLQAELPQEAAQASAWVADGGRHLCPFGDDAIDLGLRENPGASVNEPSDCTGIRERRYRRSRILVKRSPSCHGLRGNWGVSVPTLSDSRAARRLPYRRSRFPAQRGARFTDTPRFPHPHTAPPPHEKQLKTHRWRIGRPPFPTGAL